jgi:diguanylate cyclase (GGDEF)-like protein
VASVRSRDFVSRIGGDEFAVILNECPALLGTQIAETLAERIGELRVSTSQGPVGVGASIGVMALDSGDDRGIDELIRLADDACYQVKSRGGGVFVST